MINITINGSPHKIADQWSDITFQKALEVKDLVEMKLPEVYHSILFKEDAKETKIPTKKETYQFMKFQCEYLSLISGIDKQVFLKLTPTEKNGITISTQWLFERCSKFLGYPKPEDCNIQDHIEVDGSRYYRDLATVDLMGVENKLNKIDYATWSTGMAINTLIEKH